MLAKELISNDISPLLTSETGLVALNMMDEYRISNLPIIEDNILVGLLFEDDIFEMSNPESKISSIIHNTSKIYIYENQHIYDIIKVYSNSNITLLPVVDINMKYLGFIDFKALTKAFSKLPSVQQDGGIIVLEMNVHDYSLGQIAQIVEQNDTQILSCYVSSKPNSTIIEVHIKLNRMDVAPIIQSLERYDYTVKSSITEAKDVELDDRFENFMKYLSI